MSALPPRTNMLSAAGGRDECTPEMSRRSEELVSALVQMRVRAARFVARHKVTDARTVKNHQKLMADLPPAMTSKCSSACCVLSSSVAPIYSPSRLGGEMPKSDTYYRCGEEHPHHRLTDSAVRFAP